MQRAVHGWGALALFGCVACAGGGRPDAGERGSVDAGAQNDAAPPRADAGDRRDHVDSGAADAGPNLPPRGEIILPTGATTVTVGDSLDFAATCIDPEGSDSTHAWLFDGAASDLFIEDPGPIALNTPGIFTVRYVCTDELGQADPEPPSVLVVVQAPTIARILTPGFDMTVEVGDAVNFNGSCINPSGGPSTHRWDFMGGAGNSTEEDPGLVTFDHRGTYVVTYTCTQGGVTGSAMVTVTVTTRPEAVIDTPAAPVRIEPGQSVTFSGTCTDAGRRTPFVHAWDFDGVAPASNLEDPGAITFPNLGNFVVHYTCENADGLRDESPASVAVDVVIPTRWVALVGELHTDGVHEVGLVDISAPTPGPLRSVIAGGWPATGTVPGPYNQTQLSPDGQRVAFLADATRDGSDDLYVVDLRSTSPRAINLTHLPAGRAVENFRWSPDSLKIAYNADVTQRDQDELYIVDLSGGLASAVTTRAHGALAAGADVRPSANKSPTDLLEMSWSLDSHRVYFLGNLEGSSVSAYAFDLTAPASGAQRLHPPLTGSERVAAVFGVGANMAVMFADLESHGALDVYVVETSGPAFNPVRLNATPASGERGVEGPVGDDAIYHGGYPVASPDGTRVAFIGDFVDVRRRMYYADLSSGVPTAPGTAVDISPPAAGPNVATMGFEWDPAGNRLAFIDTIGMSGVFRDLYFVDLSGSASGPTTLISFPLSSHITEVMGWSWAPDGSAIAFKQDYGRDHTYEEWLVPTPASGPSLPARRMNVPLTMDFQYTGASTWGSGDRALWLSPTTYVYSGTLRAEDALDLYFTRATDLERSTRLNAVPVASSLPFPAFGLTTIVATPTTDHTRLMTRGWVNTVGVVDAVMFDPLSPGVTTPLHPPLGTGLGIDYIAGAVF